MSISVILAALFGKAAVGAVSKGVAAKASAAGIKAAAGAGHHGHHVLAQKVAGKLVEKATDKAVDVALDKAEAALAKKRTD